MGGIDAVPLLRELDPSMKLIVSSGYSDATVMSNFRKYGFDAVLPKPWSIVEVSEVLRSVIASDNGGRRAPTAGPAAGSPRDDRG